IGARVIGAPLSPQFRVLRLRIDRGAPHLAPDMPVIVGDGPVGHVDKVYGDYADVRLISDPASSVDVVIRRTGARAVLKGLGRPDPYACTLDALEKQQKAGDKVQVGGDVVTSGLGASFPPGLVVGKVSEGLGDAGR